MLVTDLYGFNARDIEVARSQVESALDIKLKLHESSFIGEYFLAQPTPVESVQIESSIEPKTKKLKSELYAPYKFIVSISSTDDKIDEIQKRLLKSLSDVHPLLRKYLDTDRKLKTRKWISGGFGPPE